MKYATYLYASHRAEDTTVTDTSAAQEKVSPQVVAILQSIYSEQPHFQDQKSETIHAAQEHQDQW